MENTNTQTKPTLKSLSMGVPAGEYMGPEQLAFFKALLIEQQQEAMAAIELAKEGLADVVTLPDECDRASCETERAVHLRLMELKRQKLAEVKSALARIESGEYGWCADLGVEIGLDRLCVTPAALYCADVANVVDRRQRHYSTAV